MPSCRAPSPSAAARTTPRAEVEFLHVDGGARSGLGDAVGGVLALVEIAHGQHHVGALGGERCGGLEADSGVGAGDDGRAAGLVGNVCGVQSDIGSPSMV